MSRIKRGVGAAFALALTGWSVAQAAPVAAGATRAGALQKLSACRSVADDAARLACFDAAAAAFDEAEAKGDVVVVEREQARKVRRQAFGFALPSLSLFERGETAGDINSVSLKVESARRGPDGKWLLRLEGGQVWRQIDTGDLTRDPKPDALVTIRKASLGSYMLNAGGAGSIRVHRDN